MIKKTARTTPAPLTLTTLDYRELGHAIAYSSMFEALAAETASHLGIDVGEFVAAVRKRAEHRLKNTVPPRGMSEEALLYVQRQGDEAIKFAFDPIKAG